MRLLNPQPLYFGAADAPLFGWWHAAKNPSGLAMVLCSPFGREEISAYRSLRQLAEMLALQGVSTLRFDYAGTGDSCGESLDTELLRTCGDSVMRAIDEAKRMAGVSRVLLGGLRIGALLATQAALARDDVAALIAIVPVVSGRAWVRELKAMQGAGEAPDRPASDDNIFESGGFAMSTTARDAFANLDLRSPDRAPAPDVLVVDRSDLPTLGAWSEKLTALGARVDLVRAPGYEQLMLDPHRSEVPTAMWETVCSWIGRRSDAAPADPAKVTDPPAAMEPNPSASMAGVRETACRIRSDRGYICAIESESQDIPPSGLAIVLLNAGATRRIGPGRLYVDVARQLARLGHRVIRVDLTGLGDSPALLGSNDNIVYTDTALREVDSVVGYMRRHADVQHCAGIGLCAGAYHAFKASVMGAPFDTVVAINPLTFFWHAGLPLDAPLPRHVVIAEMSRYRRDLFSMERVRRVLRGSVDLGRIARLIGTWLRLKLAAPTLELGRRLHISPQEDLAGELALLAARKVRMKFLFAADEPGPQLLALQGGRMVQRLQQNGTIEIRHFDTADHVFSRWASRRELADSLAESFAGHNAGHGRIR